MHDSCWATAPWLMPVCLVLVDHVPTTPASSAQGWRTGDYYAVGVGAPDVHCSSVSVSARANMRGVRSGEGQRVHADFRVT
jgi:hypothetical protein